MEAEEPRRSFRFGSTSSSRSSPPRSWPSPSPSSSSRPALS